MFNIVGLTFCVLFFFSAIYFASYPKGCKLLKINSSFSEAVSKLTLAENHHCPAPEGCADFQRLPPFREGQRRR